MEINKFDQNYSNEKQTVRDAEEKIWNNNEIEIPKLTNPFQFDLNSCPMDQLRKQLGEIL